MKKLAPITVSLLCLIVFASSMTFAGAMPKIAEHRSITFNSPTVLGTTELPAGTYTVDHQMQGEDHYMIFRQADVRKSKAIEVKVKCNLVPLAEKAKRDEQRYIQNAKNQKVLTEITFRGDEATHVFSAPTT
jgi:hypothetical protein